MGMLKQNKTADSNIPVALSGGICSSIWRSELQVVTSATKTRSRSDGRKPETAKLHSFLLCIHNKCIIFWQTSHNGLLKYHQYQHNDGYQTTAQRTQLIPINNIDRNSSKFQNKKQASTIQCLALLLHSGSWLQPASVASADKSWTRLQFIALWHWKTTKHFAPSLTPMAQFRV